MGWTDRLKLKAQPVPGGGTTFLDPRATDPKRNADAYFAEGYAANPIVFACVSIIAEAVPSVKLEVHQLDAKGDKRVVTSHKLLELLRQPNPTQSWNAFAQELVTYHRLTGEAFVLRSSDSKGKPRELYNLDPRYVAVIMPKDGSAVPEAYEYGSGENKRRYEVNSITGDSDVKHIKTANPLDPTRGLSPLSAGARSADLHNAGAKWNNSLLQNSARPSGILEIAGGVDAPVLDKIRTYFMRAWQGANNAGKVPLLTGGTKFTPLSHNPKDMDFLSSMQDSAKNIALVFGVPLPLVTMEASTFNNLEGAKERLWTDTVLPLLDVLISALSDFLMPAFSTGKETAWLAYNADSVPALEPRRERLYKRMTAAVAGGLVSPDEARVEMGFAEKGDAAAGLFMPGTMRPVESLKGDAATDLAKAMRAAGFTDAEVKQALADEFGANDNDGSRGVAA